MVHFQQQKPEQTSGINDTIESQQLHVENNENPVEELVEIPNLDGSSEIKDEVFVVQIAALSNITGMERSLGHQHHGWVPKVLYQHSPGLHCKSSSSNPAQQENRRQINYDKECSHCKLDSY